MSLKTPVKRTSLGPLRNRLRDHLFTLMEQARVSNGFPRNEAPPEEPELAIYECAATCMRHWRHQYGDYEAEAVGAVVVNALYQYARGNQNLHSDGPTNCHGPDRHDYGR